MFTYKVLIKTGGVRSAGTDANVYITLIGESATSGEHQLDKAGDDFEKNSTGTYSIITSTDLGEIKKIRIRHDNTGRKPGWFLDYISIHEENSDAIWHFPCSLWLAVDEGDGLIDRYLYRS